MRRRRFLNFLLRAGAFLPFSFLRARDLVAAAGTPAVQLPLTQLEQPWSFVEFEFTKRIKSHRGLVPSTFPGYVMRIPDAIGAQLGLKNNLYAISRICPHEGCPMKLYKDRSEAPFPLEVEEFSNPMLLCPCHRSLFDPAQGGKVISGPAPRPPWTFDFVVQKGRVIIKDLEPGGEKWG